MAMFDVTISGKVIDMKVSKKGKNYIKVYDGSSLHNVFINGSEVYQVGDDVSIQCLAITNNVYLKEVEG